MSSRRTNAIPAAALRRDSPDLDRRGRIGADMFDVRIYCPPIFPSALRMVALCALLVGLTACTPPPGPLRVGAYPWPGYGPAFLAEARDRRADAGFKTFCFPNAVDVIRAYRNRVIDVAMLTADEAMLLAQSDPEQRIIMVCDYSNGADMILARGEIGSMQELRGRKIGVESNALGAYVLSRALEMAGMTAADVTVVPSRMQDLGAELTKERVDAVVALDPVASQILAGGARRLFDSTQIPGEIIDVVVTRQSVIEGNPEALQNLVSQWFAALAHLRDRPQEAGKLISNRAQLPADTYPAAFRTIAFVGREENLRLFAGQAGALNAQLRVVHANMQRQKLLFAPVDITSLTDGRFVRAAGGRSPRLSP